MNLPVAFALVPWLAGALMAWHVRTCWHVTLPFLLCAAPPGLVIVLVSRRSAVRTMCLLVLIFLAAATRTGVRLAPELPEDHLAKEASGNPVLLEAVLADEPERTDSGSRLLVEAAWLRGGGRSRPVCGRAELYVEGPLEELRVGDIVLAEAKLQRVRNLGNPGEFDRQGRSHLRGVYVRGTIKDESRIVRLGPAPGYGLERAIQVVRERVSRFLSTQEPSDSCALLRALILADRSDLPEGVVESFRSSGVSHVLAISGLHVALVWLLGYGISKPILKRSDRVLLAGWLKKGSALAGLVPALAYVCVSGSPVTALRAACMLLCATGALLFDRPAATWNSLGVAALFLVIADPESLFSVSFALSFASVASILSVAPVLTSSRSSSAPGSRSGPLSFGTRLFEGFRRWVWPALVVSAAATVATLPLCAYFFQRISLVGIAANLFVVPLIGWGVLPLGLLAGFAGALGLPGAGVVLEVALQVSGLSIRLVELLARIPGASVRVGAPSWVELALLMALLAAARVFPRRTCKIAALVLFAAGFYFCSGTDLLSGRARGTLEITFLSVGQGESLFIVLPDGKRMLVDGGPAREGVSDAGRWVVAPFLGKERIRTLDWIVASHGHPDHYGGLRFLAEAFRPAEIWTGPPAVCDEEGYRSFLASCLRLGIRRKILCGAQEPLELDGVTIEILHPPCPSGEAGESEAGCTAGPNNQSLVMRLAYGDVNILLTGDIEAAVEKRLLDQGERLKAQVLKVPHHGSRGSSSPAFLDAVCPQIAVVSAGYRNRFGFPSEQVVGRLRERGIAVFRTDLDGAVRLRTDGRRIEVFCGPKGKRCFP